MKDITPEQKEELAQRAYHASYRCQLEKRCCSQTSLAGLFEVLEIQAPEVFKAATGLAGGGALFGDAGCGAYDGGLMIIGLLTGRGWDNFVVEETNRFRCFEAGRALHRKFIDEYGTVICRDIQTNVLGRPFFLSDKDDYAKADALGNHSSVSPEVVAKACKWTVEVIFEQGLLGELNELRRRQAAA
jgi:C_GCAxxG_C_C family probable redox protein